MGGILGSEEQTDGLDGDITLYYYPGFTGRVEPLILMLKDANVDFKLVRGRKLEEMGIPEGPYSHHAMPRMKITKSNGEESVYSQTTSMLQYLGRKIGYDGKTAESQLAMNQVALNAADIWSEIYGAKKGNPRVGMSSDGGDIFFEKRASTWNDTMSKSLGDQDYFGGATPTYPDFAMINVYEVSVFMFGEKRTEILFQSPNLVSWIQRIKKRPALMEYYSSDPEPVLYDGVRYKPEDDNAV